MGLVNIIRVGGAGELLPRLFGNTLPAPSVWCRSVYLSTCRYTQCVDGSPSIISAALIPAVRGVSGCRACLCGNRNMYC
jgi:hypothetical protein